jgi:hypothetical protein
MSSADLDRIRMEYKMDLIIRALQHNNLMLPSPMIPPLVGVAKDSCPICSGPVGFNIDFDAETTHYSCLCEIPVSAVRGISSLRENKDPNKEKKDADRRNETNLEIPQLETTRGSGER